MSKFIKTVVYRTDRNRFWSATIYCCVYTIIINIDDKRQQQQKLSKRYELMYVLLSTWLIWQLRLWEKKLNNTKYKPNNGIDTLNICHKHMSAGIFKFL